MVRLVFRPYTQVRRTICTSVSLRASTRVSSGFAPLRHSSPSFGSRQACSHSNPSQKIKTGRMGSPQADALSTQMPRHARRLRGRNKSPGLGHHLNPRRSTPRIDRRTGLLRSASDQDASPAPIRFPPDNFKHSLTLFSKSFSSLPRGTCSLSVSRPYLALDGIYRPIGAAFPNNPTRRQRLVGTWARSVAEDASPDYNSNAEDVRFSSWALPGSLAVTKGILVSFFSSAY
ncbi:unnamed protein product [Brassica rapa subsp. trilocularis]